MLKKFDRYLMEEILGAFFAASGIAFLIFFFLQALRLSDYLILHQMPPWIVLRVSGCLLLSFSHYVFPPAFLAAVMYAFGRLSSDGELTAMRASGVSLDRIALPVASLSVLASALSLLCSLELAPWGERTMTQLMMTAANRKIAHAIKPQMFNSEFFDLMIYSDQVDPETGELSQVFLYDERQGGNPVVVVAQSGRIVEVRTEHRLARRSLLVLQGGTILPQKLGSKGQADSIRFGEYSLDLKIDAADAAAPDEPRMASAQMLRDRIHTTPPHDAGHLEAQAELWKRLTLSIAPLFFSFLGIGLGTVRTRSAGSNSVLLSLITCVVYWQSLMTGLMLAKDGKWIAWQALQLPNLLSITAACYFYFRVRRAS
jgi:lipopolysaccharide export system permease protein